MYPSNRKKKVWKEEKERLLKMTLEERRKEYVRDYVPLKDIPSWKEEMKSKSQNDVVLCYLLRLWALCFDDTIFLKSRIHH